MARAKTSPRKSKSVSDQERYTAELSPGQLVIGVSILLMFGLACFILGVLIGKFDPTLQREAGEEPIEEVAAKPTPPASTTPPPEMRVPRELTEEPGKTAKKEASPSSSNETKPETVAKAVDTKNSGATSVAGTDGVLKEPTPQKEEPLETAKVSEKSSKPEPVDPKPTPPKPQPTTDQAGRYAVQIAAFKTRTRAEAAIANLQSVSSYTADVLVSETGWSKVLVGSYADKKSATQARDDLRERLEYSDCYVISR